MKNLKEKITGWGRTNPVFTEINKPLDVEEIKKIIQNAPSKSIIARGLGRSYGDVAQLNGKNVVELSNFCDLELCEENATLKAGAGASFNEILKFIVPKGFFLPVSPGTRNVTVGGAIAFDIFDDD